MKEMQITKERITFFVNPELSEKIAEISESKSMTISEIARTALANYIRQIEKEQIERELEIGYIENSEYYLRMQEEWKHADKE